MDLNPATNNPNSIGTSSPAAGAAPTSPPSPSSTPPKVFDLSSINSLNSSSGTGNGGGGKFFKKKPFIIGILSALVLTIAAITIFTISQKAPETTPPPRAASEECLKVNSTGLNQEGDTAKVEVSITNNCSTDMNVKFKREQYWCKDVKFHSSNNYIVCADNGQSSWESGDHDLKPGETSKTFTVTQKIANNGACGSAQVDVYYKTPSSAPIGPYFGTAWKQPCPGDDEAFTCLKITSTPETSTITPGQQFKFANSTLGSTGTWESTWSVTSTGANKGTLANINYNSTNWTAPTNPVNGQTWTVTVAVKDKTKGAGKEACSKVLSFATTTTYSHKVCNANNACVSVPCSPADVDCSSSSDCTSNADCQTTTYKFNTCENNACISKECPDPNTACAQDTDCVADSDCQTTTPPPPPGPSTHRACQNNACVTVDGPGPDSCTSDASCQPAATPPPIPESGNTALTIGAIILGLTAVLGGVFLAL